MQRELDPVLSAAFEEKERPEEGAARSFAAGAAGGLGKDDLLELHFFLRLAREWDLRFEKLFRTGAVSKWYSSVGNEAITVPAATAIEAGDALCTLHRDSGAVLRYYLDAEQLFPGLLAGGRRRRLLELDSRDLLHRLACQMLGNAEGFSAGHERSYHYGLMEEDAGCIHVGMISHLGAMIPVAAGLALGFRQRRSDRVALNFIGEGGASSGDFHEGLNMAAVLRVPLILIIENNRYAFSTPARQQYAAESLASRAAGYGISGALVDGNDPEAVWREVSKAVARGRQGGGPTLIEAVVGRMRGHSEGDDSILQVPEAERRHFACEDPVERFESKLLEAEVMPAAHLEEVRKLTSGLVLETVERALASPDPDPAAERRLYAD
jgi:2-oxoisovalerate dehydrogenase E1 component